MSLQSFLSLVMFCFGGPPRYDDLETLFCEVHLKEAAMHVCV